MELKNFAKKAAVVTLIASFTVGALAACSSDSNGSNSSTGKSSSGVRGKDSTYSTK